MILNVGDVCIVYENKVAIVQTIYRSVVKVKILILKESHIVYWHNVKPFFKTNYGQV